ncbi:hypothetical protein [Nonomuraea rubra]
MTAVLSLSGVLVGASLAAASPAAATTNCSTWAKKTIALPGKPDLLVEARTCVLTDGNYRKGRVQVKWSQDGLTYGNRFDKFVVQARLERSIVHATTNCDYRHEVNSQGGGSETCDTPFKYSSVDGSWIGDGKIVYNVNNDGKGDYTWGLKGSPSLLSAPGEEDDTVENPAPDPADTPEPTT